MHFEIVANHVLSGTFLHGFFWSQNTKILFSNMIWRAQNPHKQEYTRHKAVKKINYIAQRTGLDFILTCEELALHVKDTRIELLD